MPFALITGGMENYHPDEERLQAYATLFECIQDPLLVVNGEGWIIFANKAAERDFEIGLKGKVEELRCRSEEGSHFDPSELSPLIQRRASVANYRLKTRKGLDSDSAVDINELIENERLGTLKLLHFKDYSNIRESERWRDETISMVSHELKNPLAAMKNVITLLLSQAPGPLTADQRKFLATSRRSVERLTHLIESILDVSRLSSGRLELNQSWIDLHQFLDEVITSFSTLFTVRQVKLNWDVSDEIKKIYVDAAKLEQILINLLSNSLKFTRENGQIEVQVSLAGRESLSNDFRLLPWDDLPQPLFGHFAIKDTGIGMTDDTLANLYTRYYQAGSPGGKRGSHLGLNISRTLVEVQGGSFRVESQIGLGTNVRFFLPIDERTGYLLQSLHIVKLYIERLRRKDVPVTFCTIGKESGECWVDLSGSWEHVPEVNLGEDEVRDDGFLIWTLSEYLSVALIIGEKNSIAPQELFEKNGIAKSKEAYRFDGYSVGFAKLMQDGDRLEQLFNISLKRMKLVVDLIEQKKQ
jgi:signal transduction histidine kinase